MNERLLQMLVAAISVSLVCISIGGLMHNNSVNLTAGKECTSVTTGGIK